MSHDFLSLREFAPYLDAYRSIARYVEATDDGVGDKDPE